MKFCHKSLYLFVVTFQTRVIFTFKLLNVLAWNYKNSKQTFADGFLLLSFWILFSLCNFIVQCIFVYPVYRQLRTIYIYDSATVKHILLKLNWSNWCYTHTFFPITVSTNNFDTSYSYKP